MFSSETHPSRVFQYCPHCGAKSFVFKEKAFTCSVCNFVYYINGATAVAVILELPDGKIILTRRKHEPRAGFLDLPGGFVDVMERAEDAVKREIFEELGIRINEIRFLSSFPNEYPFKGLSYFTCDLAFVCPIPDNSSLKPADDVTEAISISPKDINFEQISFPSIKNVLKAYLEQRKQ